MSPIKGRLKWIASVIGVVAILGIIALFVWSKTQTGGYAYAISIMTSESTTSSKTYGVEADGMNVRIGFYPHPNKQLMKAGFVCSNLYTNAPSAGHSCYNVGPELVQRIFPKEWKRNK